MKVAFRVDASQLIGSGHLMRCLTLANKLKEHGVNSLFICRHLPEYLEEILTQNTHAVVRLANTNNDQIIDGYAAWLGVSQEIDSTDTVAVIKNMACDWLIIDHYALEKEWEVALRPYVQYIMVIDDLAQRDHDCDLLLDQNFYSNMSARYEKLVPKKCQSLLGPKYALLRSEFSDLRKQVKPRTGIIKKILVFLGGMDAANMTGQTLQALEKMNLAKDVQVDVVIGKQHPYVASITKICYQNGFILHVQTPNIGHLMAQADFSIGAGGVATWERCCLGLPTFTFIVAENQRLLVKEALKAKIIMGDDDITENSGSDIALLMQKILDVMHQTELLQQVSLQSMSIVSCDGAERVRRAMKISGLIIKRADINDSDHLYNWRNHEVVRAASHNKSPISRREHNQWLGHILKDPKRILLIGMWCDEKIGVVRFDCSGEVAEISIYLNPELELKGWGNDLIIQAESYLKRNYPEISRIEATILAENTISQRFFKHHGYVYESTNYFKKI